MWPPLPEKDTDYVAEKDEEEEVHKNEKRLYGHFRNITPHEIRQVMHLPIDEAAE